MINIKDLKKIVGQSYENYDADGNYITCFAPLYLIYPDVPRFKKPKGNRCFDFAYSKIQKYFKKVDKKNIQPFDIVVFHKILRVMHIGIYLGDGTILHAGLTNRYEIIRLSKFYKYIEVFRYE